MRRFLILVALLFSACASGRWESLPAEIYAEDHRLAGVLELSINYLNHELGTEVYVLTDNPEAPIHVFLDKNGENIPDRKSGHCDWSWDASGLIRSVQIYTKQCETSDLSVALMIHELWHALGFSGHSDTTSCLSYETSFHWLVNEPLCDEMVEQFKEKYGSLEGGGV